MRIGIANDTLTEVIRLHQLITVIPNYQVVWLAKDGEEAIAKAQESTPDVIFMKLILQHLSGVEATKRIMESTPCGIVIVATNSKSHKEEIAIAMSQGALDYIDISSSNTIFLEKIAALPQIIHKSFPSTFSPVLSPSITIDISSREDIPEVEEAGKELLPLLKVDSKLRDLKTINFQIDEALKGEELFHIFEQDPYLPGAILTRDGSLCGFISRIKFFDILSRPFGRELFLRRPLHVLYATHSQVYQNITILDADTSIFEAIKICLARGEEFLYEPILVNFGQDTYRMLPLNDLLIAQGQVYRIALGTIEKQTRQLVVANEEISLLNQRLKGENLRMEGELTIIRQMQQMLLPNPEELVIEGLDIAGFMEPADEVGGDYYDVLQVDGILTISMGDVTGHGLESGILMLMTQTAVRTLKEVREEDPVRFLDILNRTLYKNVQRMNSDKNLTLVVLNYANGKVSISGQHEETIVVRQGGRIERIDTMDLGLPIAMDENIADFISHQIITLQAGEGIVLYTDGIVEAKDIHKKQYGIQRLCGVISQNWHRSAEEIKEVVIDDVRQHIGTQKVFDDITLLVLKQLS